MKRTCVVVATDPEATAASIPRELYDVTTDRAAIPAADVLVIDGVWFSRLRPLEGMSDDEAILLHLRERGILETSDLGRLNLDELAAAPGVTRQPLHRFIRDLSRSGRYPDTNRLQEFIIRRGIFV
ncbi:MAG TPA: hypothetical protein VEO54_15630 [Thermoanaerobaculia bacterium]|nr:hypothetical protein [Thermoanaerobaculia bacterium]